MMLLRQARDINMAFTRYGRGKLAAHVPPPPPPSCSMSISSRISVYVREIKYKKARSEVNQ